MTAAQAHKELEGLLKNKKRKLSEPAKRALEYAMTLIVQKLGEEVLAKE
jgi:hypothetical protein